MRAASNPLLVVVSPNCSDMNAVGCRGAAVVAAWLLAAALVSAQLTFSRDWTGGKRTPQVFDCGQFAKLCRHFVRDLKEAMSSEMAGKHRRQESDKPPIYDDDD